MEAMAIAKSITYMLSKIMRKPLELIVEFSDGTKKKAGTMVM
jgi:hypothetical protein